MEGKDDECERPEPTEQWGKNWPRQYDAYMRTVDVTHTRYGGSEGAIPESRIERDQWLKRMFLGYAFALDFRDRRGHAYMRYDQENSKRITENPQPGACLHCHVEHYCGPKATWFTSWEKGIKMKDIEATYALMGRASTAINDMLDAIATSKAAGATPEQLKSVFDLQRKAQWRLDFVNAEDSMGIHALQAAPSSDARLVRLRHLLPEAKKATGGFGVRVVLENRESRNIGVAGDHVIPVTRVSSGGRNEGTELVGHPVVAPEGVPVVAPVAGHREDIDDEGTRIGVVQGHDVRG